MHIVFIFSLISLREFDINMEKNNTHWEKDEIKSLVSIWQQDEIMRQACTKKNDQKKKGEKVYREWSATLACPSTGQRNAWACAVPINKFTKFRTCAKFTVLGASVNGETKTCEFKNCGFNECKWAYLLKSCSH